MDLNSSDMFRISVTDTGAGISKVTNPYILYVYMYVCILTDKDKFVCISIRKTSDVYSRKWCSFILRSSRRGEDQDSGFIVRIIIQ